MTAKLVLRAGIAATALTAMGLVAATPAAAHTNTMYTYITDSESGYYGFTTYGKTDGVVAPLGSAGLEDFEPLGIEVAAEKGTAVGYISGDDGGPVVVEWNHSTGTVGTPLAAFVQGDGIPVQNLYLDYFAGLDTLNDGRTVTVVVYEANITGDLFEDRAALATVDAGTGALTPIVDLYDALTVEGDYVYDIWSVATDPLTGLTYVFLENEAHEVFFLEVNVAAGTVGEPTLFQGSGFEEGFVAGADFDADGTLYFNYGNYEEEQYELSKIGTPSQHDWVTTTRTFISLAPAQYDEMEIGEYALTIEHTALAATGAELPLVVWLTAGTVAVLAGATVVMVARRKADAGMV